MNASTIRIAVALCGLCTTLPAMAGDIRAELTPDLIYSHCQTAGIGSQTEGTFMLPGGRVTGTVLCTQADLAAANMPAQAGKDDDEDEDEDEDEDHRDRRRDEARDDED